jgi:hypothetical protein
MTMSTPASRGSEVLAIGSCSTTVPGSASGIATTDTHPDGVAGIFNRAAGLSLIQPDDSGDYRVETVSLTRARRLWGACGDRHHQKQESEQEHEAFHGSPFDVRS